MPNPAPPGLQKRDAGAGRKLLSRVWQRGVSKLRPPWLVVTAGLYRAVTFVNVCEGGSSNILIVTNSPTIDLPSGTYIIINIVSLSPPNRYILAAQNNKIIQFFYKNIQTIVRRTGSTRQIWGGVEGRRRRRCHAALGGGGVHAAQQLFYNRHHSGRGSVKKKKHKRNR